MRFVALWYVFEGIVKLVTFLKIFFFFGAKERSAFVVKFPSFFRDLTINSVALKENTRKLC